MNVQRALNGMLITIEFDAHQHSDPVIALDYCE